MKRSQPREREEKGLPVPSGVKIGGSLHSEVHHSPHSSTTTTPQHSRVTRPVTRPHVLHLHAPVQRNRAFQREQNAALHHHHRGHNQQQPRKTTPHFRFLSWLCSSFLGFVLLFLSNGVGALEKLLKLVRETESVESLELIISVNNQLNWLKWLLRVNGSILGGTAIYIYL